MYLFRAARRMRPLAGGYAAAVDNVDEPSWCRILERFDDANIFQTWSYGDVRGGRRNISHLILTHEGEIVAGAQARVVALPLLGVGVAYIRWGPLWRLRQAGASLETFRQSLRALRNEYACRRGLILRLYPVLFEDDAPCFASILQEEGFSAAADLTRARTLRLDLSRPLAT